MVIAAGVCLLALIIFGAVRYQHSTALIDVAKARLDHLSTDISNQDKTAQISYTDVRADSFYFSHRLVVIGFEVNVKGEDGIYTLRADRVELGLINDSQPGYDIAIPEHAVAIKESGSAKKKWKLKLTSVPQLQVYALSEDDDSLESYRMKFTRRISLAVEGESGKHNFVYTPKMEKDPHRVAMPSTVSHYVFDAFRVWQ